MLVLTKHIKEVVWSHVIGLYDHLLITLTSLITTDILSQVAKCIIDLISLQTQINTSL